MARPGTISYPWLAQGQDVAVPQLTLGELIEAQQRDLALIRKLGLTSQTDEVERERINEIADLAHTADVLYVRLKKADSALTRQAFEAIVHNRARVLELAGRVFDADVLRDPQGFLPDGPRKEANARPDNATGAPTPTKSTARWRTWLPRLSPRESRS